MFESRASASLQGERHVDGLAFCSSGFGASGEDDVVAMVSSKMTGNTWDGELRILRVSAQAPTDGPAGAPKVEAVVPGCAARLLTGASSVRWLTDRKTIVLAADDGNLYVYSVEDVVGFDELCLQTSLAHHDDVVSGVSVDATSKRILSSSFDGTVKLWDVTKPTEPLRTLVPTRVGDRLTLPLAWDVALFDDARSAASAHQDGGVLLWDLRAPREASRISLPGCGACLALSGTAPGGRLACGLENGSVAVLDMRMVRSGSASASAGTGTETASPVLSLDKVHGGAVHCVEFLPGAGAGPGDSDGQMLISAADDTFVTATTIPSAIPGSGQGANPAVGASSSKGEGAAAAASETRFHTDYVRALSVRPTSSSAGAPQFMTGGWDGQLHLLGLSDDTNMTL